MDYPIRPTPFTDVTLRDAFWRARLDTNRTVTVPYDLEKCEQTGRIDNFRKAAGELEGPHEGLYFNDSDVFKVIEGAAASLALHPDPDLDATLDDLIALIARAQEEDGYLYTARTIDPEAVAAEREGLTRWSNLAHNHELYNLGHLYEAAVAHHQATGKRGLLDVALKSAELVGREFGPGRRRDPPGHQEIELGLAKLHRVTGDARWLDLATFFLDARGRPDGHDLYGWPDLPGYHQDHQPVAEQEEAVGHAVRALYMYAAMADVTALTGDDAYRAALDALWEDVVARKLYLTGGVGAHHHGEAFGAAYDLPNATAYAETCAAIALVYWSHRMFLLHGDGAYLDVLERTLYNGLLAGVSLSGDTFFYPNPLASDGAWAFNVKEGATRSPWFHCSCCPTNVVRLLPALPGYVYAVREGDDGAAPEVFVNLYAAGEGTVETGAGALRLTQATAYPWDGRIAVTVEPAAPATFTLALRVPGWARGEPVPSDLYRDLDGAAGGEVRLAVNGEAVTDLRVERGFARVTRTWRPGDEVVLDLPMPVRRVVAHERVEADAGRVAVERGPLVYCAEGVDNDGRALALTLPDDAPLDAVREPDLLGGVTVVRGGGVTLVPYYAWSHRGEGEMAVWLERE